MNRPTDQKEQVSPAPAGGAEWKLRHHASVKSPADASFPGKTLSVAPTFVRVTVGTESANFKAYVRRGADGSEIFVSEATWQNVDDCAACTYIPISNIRYNWAQLLRRSRGRVVLAGLAVLVVGTVIQGSLTVGKIHPFLSFTDGQLAVMAMIGLALQVIGAGLAFLEKELLKSG